MEVLILYIFAFVIRILFLCSNSTDSWLVWYSLNCQKGAWVNHTAYNSCIEGTIGNPKLQYLIVSLFPEKYQTIAGNLLNIAYDFVVMTFIYIIAFNTVGGADARLFAFLSAMIYATAPILLPSTARLTGVKARTLSGLIGFLYFMSLSQALLFDNHIFYLVCGVISVLAVLASSFAMQVIVFFSLILSIFYMTPAPLLAFVIPVCIAYFIPGVGLKEVIRHKINHYGWYFNSYVGTGANNRNDFKGLMAEIRGQRRANIILYHLFMTQSILIAIYSLPVLFVLLYFCVFDGAFLQIISNSPVYTFYAYLVVASFLLFIIISTRYFLFLGEAERYFEYSFPFACLLMVPLFSSGRLSVLFGMGLILYQITVVLCGIFFKYRFEYFKAFESFKPDDEDVELVEMIKALPNDNPNILVIPTKCAFKLATLTPPESGMKYLLYFVTNKVDGFKYMKKAFKHYESLDFDFDYVRSEYGIDTVVVLNDQCKVLPEVTQEFLAQGTVVGRNERYTLYSLFGGR
nr:hypothetical protein [Pseudodesulfovibrio sp.]